MSRKCLRQKIIAELLRNGKLSVNELTEKTSTSRVSVSKELQALKNSEIISKVQGARGYSLSPKLAFVIFKFYRDCAELISYSLDGTVYTREKIELVYSLLYEDNILFLSGRIEKRAEFLRKQFERVVTCIIHDKNISRTPLVARVFEFDELRSQLIARQMKYFSKDEAVLYINNSRAPISFLCKDSEAVTPNAYPTEKALGAPQSSFSLIRPSRVVLEGTECVQLGATCAKNDIPLSFIDASGGLYTDERGMIEEALYKISKP